MSAPSTRPCPQCSRPVAAGDSRCPGCGATLSIVTRAIEALPTDAGAAEEADVPPDIGLTRGELLPPDDEGLEEGPIVAARSFRMSTSFSTRTVGGAGPRMDAEVKIDLPQAVVDPGNRLSPAAYWKLMHRWSEAIEREIEAASQAGQAPDLGATVKRVPLPFGPDCGGDLPVAIRDLMTRRAQHQAAGLFSLPKPADVFGPHAGPGAESPLRELLAAAERPSRPRQGFTVSCGSVVSGAMALALGLCLLWHALPH
ncbi:MAG: hypothetical protein FJX74_21545 [Armatimonadetes bacterium]|nr:hypothetical protein [Armatimonadota bacterium]